MHDSSDQINAPVEAMRAAEEAGRAAVLRWLRHPATARLLQEHGTRLRDLVPDEWAPDQAAVTDLGLAAGAWPDTVASWVPEGISPFDPRDPVPAHPLLVSSRDAQAVSGPWSSGWTMLPTPDREVLHQFAGQVRDALVDLAKTLAGHGVPIDPGSTLDLCALAQVTFCDPDWERPAKEIAQGLNLPPPAMIDWTGRDTRNRRDGMSVATENDMTTIQRWRRKHQPDYRGDEVRNKGGRPKDSLSPENQALSACLPKVLERFPDVTAGQILDAWYGGGDTSGHMLRVQMGWKPGHPPPSKRTLERLLQSARQ